jgi:O-antigen/teichoic acid export membrane protein
MKLNPLSAKGVPVFFRSQKFYSLFSSVFNSAIALITFSLLARTLTKGEFGYWGLFLTVYGIIEMLLNGLIKTPVIRMASNEVDYDFKEVIASTWALVIKTVLLSGLAGSLVLGIIGFATGEKHVLKIALWLPIYGISVIPLMLGVWNSNALMRFQRLLVIRFLSVSLFLVGVILVSYLELSMDAVFLAYVLAGAVTSIIVLFLGWSNFRYYLDYKRRYKKEILDFGKFSLGASVGSIALTNSDSLIIISFLGPEALALYEIPKRIKKLYSIPLMGIMQLSFPYFSKQYGKVSGEKMTEKFRRILGFSFLVLMPLPILIFIFSDWLVVLLGGEKYADAAIILQIFAVILFITPFDRISGIVLNVLNRPKYNLIKFVIMLSVNIIADILALLLGYGVVGIAAVTLLTKLSGIAYSYYIHRVELPINFMPIIRQGGIQIRLILNELRISGR